MIEKEEFLPQNIFEQYFLNLAEQNRTFVEAKKYEYKNLPNKEDIQNEKAPI